MEALKWQRRKAHRKSRRRAKQRRRKNKDMIILDYHKAISVNTLMAFFFLMRLHSVSDRPMFMRMYHFNTTRPYHRIQLHGWKVFFVQLKFGSAAYRHLSFDLRKELKSPNNRFQQELPVEACL